MGLTSRQARFVEEYLRDLNASQAAVRAGYSERSAQVLGSRLINHPEVRAAIERAQSRRSLRTDVDADRVVNELGAMAFLDPAQLFDEDGALRPVRDLPADVRSAIASVEVVTRKPAGGEVAFVHKFRFHSKTRALELLGKHLGMFVERHEHTVVPELVAALHEGRRRVAQLRDGEQRSN